MLIILLAIIFDTSLIKTYDLVSKKESLSWKVPIFGLIVIICTGCQFYTLNYLKQNRASMTATPKKIAIDLMQKVVTVSQYTIILLLAILLFEIFVKSYYDIYLLIAITSISYLLAISMMIFLAQRFFSWYILNKNPVIVLYGLSASILAINLIFTLLLAISVFIAYPEDILPRFSGTGPILNSYWSKNLNYGYFLTSIVSFLIMWTATSILLRHYSYTMGKAKYWAVLALPLAYFLSQFLTLFFNALGPFIQADPTLFNIIVTLFFTLSKPIGGILFGIAFWLMSRGISRKNGARNYLIISACGLVILFASNQAVVLLIAPYPPFGLATVSFVGMSSYLVMVGVYYSAVSVSLDIGLRKSIHQSVQEHSRFLHGIGRAQLDKSLQEVVRKLTKDYKEKMVEEVGIEPSITEHEMKKYVNDVLQEIKAGKNKTS
jgi:hypothetical protein